MRPVARHEIVDYATYEDNRAEFRRQVMEAKKPRRVHVGKNLTLLFENTLTVRYQVQEMMRAERIVREADIQHELDTYNQLLGGPGELGCTLLIEIEDPVQRDQQLREWAQLPEHLYMLLENGTRVRPRVDQGQRDQERLASVQYLKFDVAGGVPVAAGVDMPGMTFETRLSDDQRQALRDDLAAGE
jgi:hypothetical protein